MHRIAPYLKDLNPLLIALASMICAYFESTYSFMLALFLGFVFNILAGFKADEVKFKMWRLCNFSGHKFKDSLMELFLIVSITYFLKMLADLMKHGDKGVFIVQWLIAVALYWYVRNGLRNLSLAYPKNRWIRFVSNLISFQFNELAPESVKRAWEKSKDKEEEKEDDTNQ